MGLNLIKRRLQHICFPVNFCEISGNTYFVEHLQQLLLPIAASAAGNVSMFNILLWRLSQSCLNKKQLVVLPTPSKKTRCKTHLHNTCVQIYSTCTPSIFQLFDLKYLYLRHSSKTDSSFWSIYMYIFVNITYKCCPI